MRIHHYHPITMAYVGSSEADESPLEPGVFLIPANATDIEPPTTCDGKVAEWDGTEWFVGDVSKITSPAVDPVQKLAAFLASNPDVAELLK